jgi:Protein of unknown function (DUF3489)
VVAAMVAAQPKEIPVTKAKSKRKPASRANKSKAEVRNSVKRTTARKAVQFKAVTKSARQRPLCTSQPTSKKAQIIAMLRAPAGATIEAMARATEWQPHSVRGFLAGVVRKKLGLTLVSTDAESGRVYRIMDRTASAAA